MLGWVHGEREVVECRDYPLRDRKIGSQTSISQGHRVSGTTK